MPTNPTWEDTVETPAWQDTTESAPGSGATRDFRTPAQAEKLQRQVLPTAIAPEQFQGMSDRMAQDERYRRATAEMNDPGTGLTQAIYQDAPAAIGQGLHAVGDVIYEGGVAAMQHGIEEFAGLPADTEQTPGLDTTQAIRTYPPAVQAGIRGAEGLVRSTPQMAIAAVNPYAGALAFGFTPEGFSPKHAAIAAALPFIGTKVGAVVENIAARAGVSTESALMAWNKLGGAAGATGFIAADEAHRISLLPEAEQGQAWIDAAGNIGSQFLLGGLGHAERLKSTNKVLGERASANAETMRGIERDFNRRNARPADEGAAVPEWDATTARQETISPAAQEMPAPTLTAPSRAVETTQAASADAAGVKPSAKADVTESPRKPSLASNVQTGTEMPVQPQPASVGGRAAGAAITPEAVEALYKKREPDNSWKAMGQKIADMINRKDVEGLRGWTMHGKGFNDSTKSVVFELLGKKLPGNIEAIGAALDEWAGISVKQRQEMTASAAAKVAAEKAAKDQAQATKQQADRLSKVGQEVVDFTAQMTPLAAGKAEKILLEQVAKRSGDKIYDGPRKDVIPQMLADGWKPVVEQVAAVKDLTRTQFNRMDNRQQAEHARRKAAAGQKAEYRLENETRGGFFVVTKAEYDFANHLLNKAKPNSSEIPNSSTAKPAETPVAAVAKVQEHVSEVADGRKQMADGGKTEPVKPAQSPNSQLLSPKRAAKEIKSELVQRLEKAIEDAPSELDVVANEVVKVRVGVDAKGYPTFGSKTMRELVELNTPETLKIYDEMRLRALQGSGKKTTIAIPGDGSFTIWNTKEALQEVLTKASRLDTSSGKGPDIRYTGISKADKQWIAENKQTLEQPPAGATGINTGNLGESGMGGAKPTEFRHNPQSPTGIRNAVVDQERVKRGLPPAMEAARKDFGTTWDEAMARMDQDPEAAIRLVDQLQRQPRALSDVENALLLHRQIELQNEYGKLTRDLAQAFEDGQSFPNRLETMEELKARVAETSDKLQVLYDTGKAVGTEQGRGLASRKMLAFEDYSLAKMEMEKRAAKGGTPLSDAERAELGKLQERIAKTEQEFQAYREKQEAERANRMTDEAIREIQDELKRRPNYDPRIIQVAEEIVVKLENQAVSAQERLKAKFARTNTGLDPTIIYDLGVVGAAKIARLGLDFGKFSAAMLADFGDGIQPYLQAAWERSNLHLENEGAKYGDKAPQVKNLLRKRDASGKRENVIEGLKKGVAEGVPMELQGDYIRKLAESFVEGGITKREPLIDAVHDVLTKQLGLDMTRRETMDAISGYGKFKPLNTNAIKATLRDLRGQMQQVSKLEDIQARKPLQKTGVERRSPSDEERRLVQQVNEAKRRFGVVVNDPARQLKSALDAIKTRLKHQIADIEYQLNTKERIVKTKSPSPVDAETQLLELRRDGLRAQLDELLPKPGLTPEQQIARVMASLERSVADYERRIKGGDVAARERKTPLSSPALEALRARRDAVKAEWQELRELNETYQREQYAKGLERQKSALEESIKAKESQLAAGPSEPVGRAMNRPADPMLESLMQQRDALAAKIAEARRKPESVKYAEQMARKLETMQRQIAERQAKFDAGDFAANTRPTQQNRPLPPELEIAKQQLEAITAKIIEARKGPALSPEAKALKALKARMAQSTANYMDRLARRDFKKREHFEPRLDAEALRLKAENEIAKREFHRGLIMDRLANQSTGQKIYGGVKEMLNLPRNLLSSWDVSAVLRQGGFIGLGNPARAAAALGPMFRALASEKAAVMVEQEILSRPNAPLYKQAKLYLAPHEALHLSAMEEQIMSRLAGKVPGLRASNRAYITFLNRLRADSFDALLESVARKDGSLNQPEMQAIANYVNVATGRGDLGRAAAAAETLATVFFSPRLVASRFQLLAGQPLYGGSARTRQAIALEYGKFLAGIGVVYALGSLAGASIEHDPRGSDFGKLRFGDTRVDVLGGLGQVSVLLSRLGTGETRTMDGELRSIRGDLPYGARTSQDVIADFLRSKLSPVAGAAVDMVQQKNVVGEPVTAKSVATNLTIPLSFRDIYDVMQDQGMTRGSILTILSLFGFGLQHYDARQRNSTVDEMMKHVRGLTPEQRATVRAKLEETTK